MLHPGHLDRIVYKAKRKEAATILIQCFVRMWLARKTYVSLCRAAMRIQKHARIFLEQKRGINCLKTSPAVTIQVHFDYYLWARVFFCILLF